VVAEGSRLARSQLGVTRFVEECELGVTTVEL
jgi:hypothetical protein